MPDLVSQFKAHCARVDRSGVLLVSTRGQGRAILPCRITSRFRPPGQEYKRRDLMKRLSRDQGFGVLLTLTTRRPPEATANDAAEETKRIWRQWATLRTWMNQRRKRARLRKLEFVLVLEFTRAGWPHLHVWFPGLKYLMPHAELSAAWGGHVWVSWAGGSASRYVTKYLSKGHAHGAILWRSRAKSYAASSCFYVAKKPPPLGAWYSAGLVKAGFLATATCLVLPGPASAAVTAVHRSAEIEAGCWSEEAARAGPGRPGP